MIMSGTTLLPSLPSSKNVVAVGQTWNIHVRRLLACVSEKYDGRQGSSDDALDTWLNREQEAALPPQFWEPHKWTHPEGNINLTESEICDRKVESKDKSWYYRSKRTYHRAVALCKERDRRHPTRFTTVGRHRDINGAAEAIGPLKHEQQ